MTRSPSTEPKGSTSSGGSSSSRRKGTRSVSTLTASQLARKRANDREAQRAIRARTKDHIERLEQEVQELKGQQGRDRIVQELMRRNKALEDELRALREGLGGVAGAVQSMPTSATASSYAATPSYDDSSISIGSAAMSPRSSPFPSTGDFTSLPDHTHHQHIGTPYVSAALSSAVSSPASSVVDDFPGPGQGGYIPTSMPASMMPSSNGGSNAVSPVGLGKEIKLESYGDVDASHHTNAGLNISTTNHSPPPIMAHALMQQQQHQAQQSPQSPQSPTVQHQHQPWGLPEYQPMFFAQMPSLVH